MDWGPKELLPFNLGLPLLKRGELLIVLIEVLEEFFEQFVNLLVNPWSILKFDYQVKSIDHRHVLEAKLVFLQIIKHHADDADNLFFVKVVKNL